MTFDRTQLTFIGNQFKLTVDDKESGPRRKSLIPYNTRNYDKAIFSISRENLYNLFYILMQGFIFGHIKPQFQPE
jgi:hypothetical protein